MPVFVSKTEKNLMKFVGTFYTYFHKEFHMPVCNVSLVITINTLKFSHKVTNLPFSSRAYPSRIYHIKFQEFHNFKVTKVGYFLNI